MFSKLAMTAAATLLFLSSVPARAQPEFEVRLHELHVACDHGDRAACVRFGMLLGEHKEKLDEWRHSHAEYFWWDKR